MMTIENRTKAPPAALAADLRQLVNEETLLRITLEAVADSEPFRPVTGIGSDHLGNPMMLTLISYAYASGIYSSQEIENALLRDKTMRYICARKFPRWQDLRRFRRGHRARIERALAAVVLRLYVEHVLPGRPEIASQLMSAGNPNDFAQRESEQRLQTAILMDGVEADT